MNESSINGFLHLAEVHADAVADIKKLRQSGMDNGGHDAALALAVAREEEARAALIEWKPDSNIGAQSKFLYMVQYLVSTRKSLDRQEMVGMVNSIEHLVKAKRN
jgi:hypothetical protein